MPRAEVREIRARRTEASEAKSCGGTGSAVSFWDCTQVHIQKGESMSLTTQRWFLGIALVLTAALALVACADNPEIVAPLQPTPLQNGADGGASADATDDAR